MILKFPPSLRSGAMLGGAIVALVGAAFVSAPGSALAAGPPSPPTTPGNSYVGACPSSEHVAPALNVNLISNPDGTGSTPYTSYSNFPYANDTNGQGVPDCWTAYSPADQPNMIFTSAPAGAVTGSGTEPNGGRIFFGGWSAIYPDSNYDFTVSPDEDWGTQLIDLSSISAGGQPFILSADLGGYISQPDDAALTATFEDADGNALSTAQAGPVTVEQRNSVSELLPEEATGTVPAGTTQVLVTLTIYYLHTSDFGDNGDADNLDLTIGPDPAPLPFQNLPYVSPSPGGALYSPAGLSAANGTVYVSNTGVNQVAALTSTESGSSQAYSTSVIAGSLAHYGEHGDGGKAAAATLYQPYGTAEDSKGDIFIADAGDNVVREITKTGVIRRIAGTPGIAGLGYAGPSPFGFPAQLSSLDHPEGVAVNGQGDVFIADTYDNRVVQVTPGGQVFEVAGDGTAGYSGDGGLADFAQLDQPDGLAVDGQGNLYIADSGSNVIRRVDAKTGIITTVAGDYAADKASDGLGGFSGDGGPATSAQLNDPEGVALDGAGDLFIADTFNNAVREVAPGGTISSLIRAGDTAATLSGSVNAPYGVAVDQSTGTLYVGSTGIQMVPDAARPGTAAGPTAPIHS